MFFGCLSYGLVVSIVHFVTLILGQAKISLSALVRLIEGGRG
jgi:hypothetical protein